MRSVMQHTFSQVPKANIQRSAFKRDHGYKTTFDAGWLVPVFVDEALPGDTFNCNMTAFARLATPLTPFMDNLFVESFFFAVPYRLIWDNWERFNGSQDNPGDTTDYLTPVMSPAAASGGYAANSLEDYFGLPVGVENLTHVAFWHRAYNLIWNEWFRDENLQNSVEVPKGDGPDDPSDYTLLKRGKRRDYFTSCLPWPQKGPSVELPLGGDVKVLPGSASHTSGGHPYGLHLLNTSDGLGVTNRVMATNPSSRLGVVSDNGTLNPAGTALYPANLYADLSEATAATVNQLREAFQIQKMYEKDARGGTRYTELVKSHFGVTSPDARLQRPEYLGGGHSPVNITPVPQTSEGTTESPQANLAAYGTMSMRGHSFNKSFTEHCVIIGMICCRADLTYQQGLDRMWSRRTRWDFYWPSFAHLGEQAVLSKEIYADGTAGDESVFGYQERYAEYRYKPSKITGEFRSSYPQSLDSWHLSQDFAARPVLNATFIQEDPPIDRVIAVTEEPHFLLDCFFNLRTVRPMPIYSVPGLIDHF